MDTVLFSTLKRKNTKKGQFDRLHRSQPSVMRKQIGFQIRKIK
jgi:hypothetical protein